MKTVFNTGRHYTEQGQIIAAVYRDGIVSFYDVSRCVDGSFEPETPIVNEAELQSLLMHRYDHGDYKGFLDWQMRDELATLSKSI